MRIAPPLAALVLASAVMFTIRHSAAAAPAYVPPGSTLSGIGQEYLALGDSLATGMGSSQCPFGCAGRGGYVGDFAAQLQSIAGHSVTVRDLAVNGETTASFIGDYFTNPTSRSQLARAVAEIRSHGPSISPITLDIGGNDALNVHGTHASLDQKEQAIAGVRTNVETIVTTLQNELQAAGAQSDFVLLAYYQPFGQDDADSFGLARINQTIKDIAAEHGLRVAEPFADFAGIEQQVTWMSCNCPIGIHPNDRGYALIANELMNVTYAPADTTGSVAGAITDGAGNPIAGATVWYGDGWTTTDSLGRYELDGVGSGASLRFAAFKTSAGLGAVATATVQAGGSTTADMVLTPDQYSAATGGIYTDSRNDPAGYARAIAALLRSAAQQVALQAAGQARNGVTAQVTHGTLQHLRQDSKGWARQALGALIGFFTGLPDQAGR